MTAKAPRSVVSGATGLIGRAVVERLLAEGHDVVATGRRAPSPGLFSGPVRFVEDHLEPVEDHAHTFAGADNFVHCAFDHLPGRFRGGEGDDPARFRRLNVDGTLARFRAATEAGVKRVVFLSSRAVYDGHPSGAVLAENTPARPTSLYGEVKLECEEGLATLADGGLRAASLRVTGVYGPPPPPRAHKWAALVADHLSGEPQPSRSGTEVHADDVASAVLIALTAELERPHEVLCVSDLAIDNADILALANECAGRDLPLPVRADPSRLHAVDTARLRALGWRPGGRPLFQQSVRMLVSGLADAGSGSGRS